MTAPVLSGFSLKADACIVSKYPAISLYSFYGAVDQFEFVIEDNLAATATKYIRKRLYDYSQITDVKCNRKLWELLGGNPAEWDVDAIAHPCPNKIVVPENDQF